MDPTSPDVSGELLGAVYHDDGIAEISLRMTWRVGQRHKHLLASTFALGLVIRDDRVAADEPMLVPKRLYIRFAVWRWLRRTSLSVSSQASMISVNPSSFRRLIGIFRR